MGDGEGLRARSRGEVGEKEVEWVMGRVLEQDRGERRERRRWNGRWEGTWSKTEGRGWREGGEMGDGEEHGARPREEEGEKEVKWVIRRNVDQDRGERRERRRWTG